MQAQKKTTIGGQAIMEGIVMRGPKITCTVVRRADGELITRNRPTPKAPRLFTLPILRGAYGLYTALSEGMEAITYSASFFEDEQPDTPPSRFEQFLERHFSSEKIEKLLIGISSVLGVLFPVVLFMLLPSFLSGLLPEGAGILARNALEGLIRITLFLLFMWSVSHMKDIERTFRYHGAEHKTIFCYEAGLPLTVENVRAQGRFHPRCGTSFLFVLIILMTIVSTIFFSFIPVENPFLRVLVHLVLLPLVVGLSYECSRYAGRSDSLLSRLLRAPGLWVQRLTVFEPDEDMMALAICAMQAVIPDDNSDNW